MAMNKTEEAKNFRKKKTEETELQKTENFRKKKIFLVFFLIFIFQGGVFPREALIVSGETVTINFSTNSRSEFEQGKFIFQFHRKNFSRYTDCEWPVIYRSYKTIFFEWENQWVVYYWASCSFLQ